jgi:ABC-type Mn2+/Zn2+ transport system ATPase subunit
MASLPVDYASGMRLEAVGKRYGVRQPWVVRDVSLDVPGGRLIRVEGRNGSGKSTLLKVAAGVCLPSRGRVSGRPRAGHVPERFPGGLPFSARDYLLHMARVHGLAGSAGPDAVDALLERLGASGYAGSPLRTLSKGTCQKVAVAQALLARAGSRPPGLLVLDEAWTGLDQAARGTLDAAIVDWVAAGGTALFVDHDPARLAGRASERWQLDGAGRVTAVPGDHTAPRPAAGQDSGSVVMIELSGLEEESVAGVAGLPGVLGCAATGRPGATARVLSGHSDDVLRTVLSWDGVRVLGVRAPGERGGSR